MVHPARQGGGSDLQIPAGLPVEDMGHVPAEGERQGAAGGGNRMPRPLEIHGLEDDDGVDNPIM